MPFDPSLPQTNSPISSEELRNQFNELKSLIDQRITEETLNQTVDSITNSVQEMIGSYDRISGRLRKHLHAHRETLS